MTDVKSRLRRSSLRPALITALAVAAALLALNLLQLVVSLATSNFGYGQTNGLYELQIDYASTFVVPLAITAFSCFAAVFLSLWLIAPVTASTTLASTIRRSLIAVAGYAVVRFVVILGVGLPAWLENGLFGNSLMLATGGIGSAVLLAAQDAVLPAITTVPLIVLGVVLLWVSLRHPSEVRQKTAPESV